MKRLIILFLAISCMVSVAAGKVSTRVWFADGNAPFLPVDSNLAIIEYPDIMVGTELTIIVDSNMAEQWDGGLYIIDPYRERGVLSGRNYSYTTWDWAGSRLEAAGTGARVYDWQNDLQSGFDLCGHRTAVAGDWFVIDYTATHLGRCMVGFYDYSGPGGVNTPEYYLSFCHVRTRNFNDDAIVDFADFAVLASYWRQTSCGDPDWCEGVDINTDRNVDLSDIKLFAGYWLEKTGM